MKTTACFTTHTHIHIHIHTHACTPPPPPPPPPPTPRERTNSRNTILRGFLDVSKLVIRMDLVVRYCHMTRLAIPLTPLLSVLHHHKCNSNLKFCPRPHPLLTYHLLANGVAKFNRSHTPRKDERPLHSSHSLSPFRVPWHHCSNSEGGILRLPLLSACAPLLIPPWMTSLQMW